MRVAFLDDFHDAYGQTDGVARLRQHAEVEIFTDHIADPAALNRFDALVATRERTRFTAEFLSALSNVRVIAQTGNHAYHVDLDAAERLNIVIGKATGGFCTSAGELTFALMMAVMRQIPTCDQAVKKGAWPTPMTYVLRGKTLGIVGLGNIGKYVARIAEAFGMKVLAWGPRLTPEAAAAGGAEYRDLDDLMGASDIVTIHATMGSRTLGLIDARQFSLMKPTAYLVNTSRGPIVDEAAMVAALSAGRIAGAGLDVFDQEPLPANHPLTRLSNVVLTPHLGWPTDEMYGQFADAAADILLDFKDGKTVPHFQPGTDAKGADPL
ncbi:D-2-hydroxyacid dehydrogenase family protein [Amorphus sp. MBR-141]